MLYLDLNGGSNEHPKIPPPILPLTFPASRQLDRAAAAFDTEKRLCLPRSPTARPDRICTLQGDYVIPPVGRLAYKAVADAEIAADYMPLLTRKTPNADIMSWQVKHHVSDAPRPVVPDAIGERHIA